MINQVEIKNFGPLNNINWDSLGKINVITGNNGTGKTFLLKSIYSAIKTVETFGRGNDKRGLPDVLIDKIYWTFQPDKIGDLVTKGSSDPLAFTFFVDSKKFHFSYGKDTAKQISIIESHVEPRASNSIFIPAKEVLSLQNIIIDSRENEKVFGFDDTYFDLAKALMIAPERGKNHKAFSELRHILEETIGGRLEYSKDMRKWLFKKEKHKFEIGVVAEGIKKLSILDTLFSNKYLDMSSIILIDEPESALHPSAIAKFMDMLGILAKCGVQVFLSTHSYFVIKKLYLLAYEQDMDIPLISFENNSYTVSNLKDGISDNSIIRESIDLYKQEIKVGIGD